MLLSLPQVTLCAVSSIAIPETLRALDISRRGLNFARTLLFTDQDVQPPVGIEICRIDPIGSREEYSRFMLKELGQRIDSDFALIVQWDGYVLHPHNWRDEFLAYDYIGARWPHFDDGHTVGNGGFSLRSRKLLMACTDARIDSAGVEDLLICRKYRGFLETEHAIKFAPEAVAERFSNERTPLSPDALGFHGIYNMPAVMGAKAFSRFYLRMDHGKLHRREKRDLRRIAWRCRSPSLLYALAWARIRRWLKRT